MENVLDIIENSTFGRLLAALKILTFFVSCVIVFFIMKSFLNNSLAFLIGYFSINTIISASILHFGDLLSYLDKPKVKQETKSNKKPKFTTFFRDCFKIGKKVGYGIAFLITIREIFFSILDNLFEISAIWLIGTLLLSALFAQVNYKIFSASFNFTDFATLLSLIEIIFGFSKYTVDRTNEKASSLSNQLGLYAAELVSDLVNYDDFVKFLEKEDPALKTEIEEYVENQNTFSVQQGGMRARTMSIRNFSDFAKLNLGLMFDAIEKEAKENDTHEQKGRTVKKLSMLNLKNAYKSYFKSKKDTAMKEIDSDISRNFAYFVQIKNALISRITLLDDAIVELLEDPKSKRNKKEEFEDFYEDFQRFCVKTLVGKVAMLSDHEHLE